MITQINLRNQQFKICEINAQRGQMIVEYLLIAVAAIGAIVAVSQTVAWKTMEVAEQAASQVDEIDAN